MRPDSFGPEPVRDRRTGSSTQQTGPGVKALSTRSASAVKRFLQSDRARPLAVAAALVLAGLLALGLRFGFDAPAGLVDLFERLGRPPPAAITAAPEAAPAKGPDPLHAFDPVTRELLTAAFTEWPTRFSNDDLQNPRALCRWLRSRQLGRTDLERHVVEGESWICNSDLATFGAGDPATVSSLFASLKGSRETRIDYVRLKLNLIEEASAATIRDKGAELLREIHAHFGWPLPTAVDEAVREGREIALEYKQMTYQVTKEFSDPRRINVVLTVRPDTGILPADRFTADLSILPIALRPVRPGRGPAATPAPAAQ